MKQSLFGKRVYYFLASSSLYARYGFTVIIVCAAAFGWRVVFLHLDRHVGVLRHKLRSAQAKKAMCVSAYGACQELGKKCKEIGRELGLVLGEHHASIVSYVSFIMTTLARYGVDLFSYSLADIQLKPWGYQFSCSLRLQGAFCDIIAFFQSIQMLSGFDDCAFFLLERGNKNSLLLCRCRLSFILVDKECL